MKQSLTYFGCCYSSPNQPRDHSQSLVQLYAQHSKSVYRCIGYANAEVLKHFFHRQFRDGGKKNILTRVITRVIT